MLRLTQLKGLVRCFRRSAKRNAMEVSNKTRIGSRTPSRVLVTMDSVKHDYYNDISTELMLLSTGNVRTDVKSVFCSPYTVG